MKTIVPPIKSQSIKTKLSQWIIKTTLSQLHADDFVYADPSYIGRHVDYFDSWSEDEEIHLKNGLCNNESQLTTPQLHQYDAQLTLNL